MGPCFPCVIGQIKDMAIANPVASGVLCLSCCAFIHVLSRRMPSILGLVRYACRAYVRHSATRGKSTLLHDWFDKPLVVKSVSRTSVAHTHTASACERDNVTAAISAFIKNAGCVRYDISSSRREMRDQSVMVERDVHVVKDTWVPARRDRVLPHYVITMIDVDYYVDDMEKWAGHHVLLYTFDPVLLAGHDKEIVYRRSGNGYEVAVSGGERYSHKAWNYDVSQCLMHSVFRTYSYRIDKLRVSNTHSVVLMTPKASWYDFCGIITKTAFPGEDCLKPLPRVGTRRDELISRRVYEPSAGVMCQLAYGFVCVSVPEPLLVAIENYYAVRSANVSVDDIRRRLIEVRVANADTAATLILNYLKIKPCLDLVIQSVPLIMPNVGGVKSPALPSYFDDKGGVTVHGPSLAQEPAVYHVPTPENAVESIHERVVTKFNDAVPPWDYRDEFIALMRINTCSPVDSAAIYELQNKPIQRGRNARADGEFSRRSCVITMGKREVVPAGKSQRNITTFPAKDVVDMSRYTTPFKENNLLRQKWYCPGKHPPAIAARVMRILHGRRWVCGDFSNFDASVSQHLRDLQDRVYVAAFGDDVKYALSLDRDRSAKTPYGGSYDTVASRMSGSPFTTDGNTIISAYVVYAAYRNFGLSPKCSYDRIGLCYGDDTITAVADTDRNRFMECFKTTAQLLGLTLKLPDEPYPCFISRYFVDIQVSSFSVCVIKRALPRLATSIGEVDKRLSAWRKIVGYRITDSKTPVISEYLQYLAQKYGEPEASTNSDEIAFKRNFSTGWQNGNMPDAAYDCVQWQISRDVYGVIQAIKSATCDEDIRGLI